MGTDLLLWGEDEFLLRDAAREALGDIRPVEVDGGSWAGGETADLATPSLFGEPRALLVTDCQDLDEPARREIKAYLGSPSPDAHLVLTGRGIRAAPPVAKDLKGLVEVRKVEVSRRELTGWLAARARRRGIRAEGPALAVLIGSVGDAPAELDQALEQLAGAFPGLAITAELVEQQFRGLGDRKTWEVCDAAFGGDLAAALRALQGMLVARDDPLMILGGIASRLRDLERVAALPPQTSAAQVAKAAGLRFDWQARRYRDQVRRYAEGELADLHLSVVEADRALKSGSGGEVVLPLLLARIAKGIAPERVFVAPRVG